MKLFKVLLILSATFCLSHCGSEEKAQDVAIDVFPSTANIYVRKFSYESYNEVTDEYEDHAPNWVRFGVTLKNNSEKPVTILAMLVKFTDINGQTSEHLMDLLEKENNGDTVLQPGASVLLRPTYFDNLPNGGEDNSYTVDLKVEGWYGESVDTAGDSIYGVYSFTVDSYD